MAYGSFYDFSLGSFFYSIDASVIIWGIVFIIFVGIINYALSKIFRDNRTLPPILAVLISILTVYFMAQSGNFENLIFNLNFIEIEKFLPWIFLAISILTIWRLGFGMYLIIVGVLLTGLGILGISAKSGLALTTGIILILVGIKLHMIRRRRRKLRGLDYWARQDQKDRWKMKERQREKNWNEAGQKIGRWGAKKYYGTERGIKSIPKRVGNLRGFDYQAGMRRGGKTSHKRFNNQTGRMGRVNPGSFVSRESTKRYARRFGNSAARRRFGK